MRAVLHGNVFAVEAILKAGADINAVDNEVCRMLRG
jgi:ankyrin repeat protein